MTDPHVQIVAHHYLLLAVPAFVPAVVVVAVVLYAALRDRRAGGDESGKPVQPTDAPDESRD
jgi:hypothetical protein